MSAASALRKLFTDKLSESGLTETVARTAGLSALTAEQTSTLWSGAPKQPALRIPYLDPLGHSTDFYRVRLLGELNGFAHQLTKPLRYLQPPASGVQVYFPHVAKLDWMTVLSSADAPLIITEGELKALAATVAGYPTLGLGGVDSWHSKAARVTLLPELAAIPWEGRTVYICYDSDVAIKPQVVTAAVDLAAELGSRGARVFDAALPENPDAPKLGLDDFLVLYGARRLATHLQEAQEFASVRELHQFNARFIFVRELAQVYEVRTQHFYEAGKFMSSVEANAVYRITRNTPQGLKTEKRSTAKDWIGWPSRRSVQKVNYVPGSPDLILTSSSGVREINVWRGWGVAPRRGDVTLWLRLFRYLSGGEPDEVRRWFEQWLAYPLQHPGTKLYTAVAMWGAQTGTGKTLLGETMIRIYGENGQRIGAKQLSSAYNSWSQRKQFIMGDEITGNESRAYADELKGLITGEWIRINEKFMPEYDLPNCVNFYLNSNHPDAFFVEDKDRRFFVLEAPDTRLEQEFYQEYHRWLLGPGPAALFDYLLRVDLKGFDPRMPALRTRAHEVMVESNRSDVGRFINLVMSDPEQAKLVFKVPAEIDLFSSKELLIYYDPRNEKRVTEKAISIELQKQGAVKVLRGVQVRTAAGRMRIYAVRNLSQWRNAGLGAVRNALSARQMTGAKF